MTNAAADLRRELTEKPRTPWERNGFEDGLAARDDRIPEGRMATRDAYLVGWRDGEQVRLMDGATT